MGITMKKNITENFRIKVVEPIKKTSFNERKEEIKKAHYNIFFLPAEKCCIDLLTDSGTGAMSTKQWASLMLGDESYAGSNSWYRFQDAVQDITGMKFVFPTHQGRAAESIFASTRLQPNHVIPNNSHFDTTRANIEYTGAKAEDCLIAEGYDSESKYKFKGNMDLIKLKQCIDKYGVENIPFAMLTVTNNTGGGQPVSMENIREVKTLLNEYNIPLVLDACRFAENSYFISLMKKKLS